jgi:hypothetical protein
LELKKIDEKWDYVKKRRYLTQNKKLQDYVASLKGKSVGR